MTPRLGTYHYNVMDCGSILGLHHPCEILGENLKTYRIRLIDWHGEGKAVKNVQKKHVTITNDPRKALEARVRDALRVSNIDPAHYQWYIDHISPEAVEHQAEISEQQIKNAIVCGELFGDLPAAIKRYLDAEKSLCV